MVLELRDGDAHYHLLETIRQYAREKLLDAGECEPWRDRHLTFFLQLAQSAEVPIYRHEIWAAIKEENRAAARAELQRLPSSRKPSEHRTQ